MKTQDALTLKDVAVTLWQLGYTPIPLKADSKSPAIASWAEFHDCRPTLDEVQLMFENHVGNIGVILGRPHNEVCVLDVDDIELFLRTTGDLLDRLLSLPTPIVKTPKGFHIYFRYPSGVTFTVKRRLSDIGAELRGDRAYVVIPPSSVNGKTYQWLKDPATNPPIPLPAEVYTLFFAHQTPTETDNQRPSENGNLSPETIEAVKVVLSPYWTVGNRHNLSLYLAGWLAKEGYSLTEVETLLTTIAEASGDEEMRDRLRAVSDTFVKATNGGTIKGWDGLREILDQSVLNTLKALLGRKPSQNGNETLDRPSNPTTDLGNAERLAKKFGEILRFVPQWGWVYWDGRRWVRDVGNCVVTKFAEETVKEIYHEASEAGDPSERVKLAKWAIASESRHRISAMIELATALLHEDASKFDNDPYLLNCLNGVVNLRTGELLPHDPSFRITKLCPVVYDPDAKAPTWEKFLSDIFCGDQSLIDYIQRAVGYSATGDVCEDAFFICWGSGSNGKSTFINVISHVLGDYAKAIAPDALLRRNQQSDTHPTAIADLCGVRFGVAMETDEGRVLSAARVKMLTGRDTVKARFMRRDYFQFKPTHKLWLVTNHKPIVPDTTPAMWRRIHLIPFVAFFDEKTRDTKMTEKLLAEAEGILAWIVKGCLEWQKVGLNPPKVVREATREYQTENDKLQLWLEECCVPDPKAVTPFSDLYASYENWCRENDEEVVSKKAFANMLLEKGYKTVKTRINGKTVKAKVGLRLRDDADGQPPNDTDPSDAQPTDKPPDITPIADNPPIQGSLLDQMAETDDKWAEIRDLATQLFGDDADIAIQTISQVRYGVDPHQLDDDALQDFLLWLKAEKESEADLSLWKEMIELTKVKIGDTKEGESNGLPVSSSDVECGDANECYDNDYPF